MNNKSYEKHSGIEIFYQLVKVWIALLIESLLMQNAKT